MTISEFYTSQELKDLIDKICSSYSIEMKEYIKSELFDVLLTDKIVNCKTCDNCLYRKKNVKKQYLRSNFKCTNTSIFGSKEFELKPLSQQIYYSADVLKKMAHSSTSPFYRKYNTRIIKEDIELDYNFDQPEFEKREFGYLDVNKIDQITQFINEKLNQEFEWHQVYYFRMNLLPYPGCNKETYSWSQIAKMHQLNGIQFSRSAVHKIIKPVIDRVIELVLESNILSPKELEDLKNYMNLKQQINKDNKLKRESNKLKKLPKSKKTLN